MDPLAHTLFGAALAETGLKRTTRYATFTLIVGANLPDIDVIAHAVSFDTALYFRRGWSHGIVALIVLPLLLTGGVWLWNRWRERQATQGPPFRLGAILGLSYLGVISHLFLDWLNTYGVRLLMPFDGRWFYGDTLFIIDPWFWLLAAVGVVLARSDRVSALVGWALLGTLTTLLILTSDFVPTAVKTFWLLGLAGVVIMRWKRRSPAAAQTVTRVGLATLVLYIGTVYGLARIAESHIQGQYPEAREVQSNPLPGRPHTHRMVVVEDDHYHIIQGNGEIQTVPRQRPNAVVQKAMEHESVQGFMTWTRHPWWEVETTDAGWRVRFYDLRYVEPGQAREGIGFAEVEVPRENVQTSP